MFKKQSYIIIILAIIFGGVYLWLVAPLPAGVDVGHRFDWPDAGANYYWSVQYANSGKLFAPEPLNDIAANQIHPRSFNVLDDGSIVPGSFLGLIMIFGILAKVFTIKAIIYFTPVISIFGVLAFYGIIRRIFNDKVGFLSAVLLLIHPAWWYYSVTSMLPNVIFVSLFLISIYLLLKANDDKARIAQFLWSGIFFGLSLSIRPSEIFWMTLIYLTVLFYIKSKIKPAHLLVLGIAFVAVLYPSFYQQKAVYGSYLSTGYTEFQAVDAPGDGSILDLVKSVVIPFGIHPNLVINNLWLHFVSRMWWLSLLTLLGLVAFLVQTKRQRTEIFGYVIMSFFVFSWLGVYYGSWEFSDKLTVHLNTLGLSYVRYWLPLFILAIPFMAIGLVWLTNIIKLRWRNLGLAVFIFVLLWMSADLVLYKKADSIIPVKNRIVSYKQNSYAVNKLTEPESIIVTVRKDKLFFPDRKVIHTFEALSLNSPLLGVVDNLLEAGVRVYYYALGPEPTLDLKGGLSLVQVSYIGQEILYEVKQ